MKYDITIDALIHINTYRFQQLRVFQRNNDPILKPQIVTIKEGSEQRSSAKKYKKYFQFDKLSRNLRNSRGNVTLLS